MQRDTTTELSAKEGAAATPLNTRGGNQRGARPKQRTGNLSTGLDATRYDNRTGWQKKQQPLHSAQVEETKGGRKIEAQSWQLKHKTGGNDIRQQNRLAKEEAAATRLTHAEARNRVLEREHRT